MFGRICKCSPVHFCRCCHICLSSNREHSGLYRGKCRLGSWTLTYLRLLSSPRWSHSLRTICQPPVCCAAEIFTQVGPDLNPGFPSTLKGWTYRLRVVVRSDFHDNLYTMLLATLTRERPTTCTTSKRETPTLCASFFPGLQPRHMVGFV